MPQIDPLRLQISRIRFHNRTLRPHISLLRVNFSPLRVEEKKPPVVYQTLSPLGPLPCFLSLQYTIMHSRATGIADHILPLRLVP